MELTDPLLIEPIAGPVDAIVRVPGSKSYTNRALAIAALASGRSRLTGVLDSEDTRVMMESLRRLRIPVAHDPVACEVAVEGCAGLVPADRADLFLANSGTSIRFLAAITATGHGTYTLDGVERMRQRPIADLLTALESLGVDARSVHGTGCPPVIVRASGLSGGTVSVRGDVSSQFLSALLIVAPVAGGPITIRVEGPLVSQPYIDMTLAAMQAFGATFERRGYEEFSFSGRTGYVGRDYAVEPDASSASYFFAAAAITGGTVTVPHLGRSCLQGDLRFVWELERMGCRVAMTDEATTVTVGPLHGIETDLADLSDTVPTLAAVACFANSPTRIGNVGHIRRKETDRLAALAAELARMGVGVAEHDDGLTVRPGPLRPAVLETYNDHRMAMSLALIGLRVPGIAIRNPSCTNKTYPAFFSDLAALRAKRQI